MLTKAELTQLITRGDRVSRHAVGRALVHLLNRQTQEEQRSNTTRSYNLKGFTPADARTGSVHAKYYIKHGYLQDWQVAYWLVPNVRGTLRLAKYHRQLAEEVARRKKESLL
jgi:hypothetical protein